MGFLSLMDDNGDTRDDLKCPEDAVGEEIRNAIDKETDILVTCLSACGEECVIATKATPPLTSKKSWSLASKKKLESVPCARHQDLEDSSIRGSFKLNNCRRFKLNMKSNVLQAIPIRVVHCVGFSLCNFNLKIIFVFI